MNPTSLIGHLLELIVQTDRTKSPPDKLIAAFFKERKYLGSHDRRFIAEAFFGVIRHRRLVESLLEGFVANHPDTPALLESPGKYLAIYAVYQLTRNAPPQPGQVVPPAYWKTYFPALDPESFAGWITEHLSLDYLEGDDSQHWGVRYSFPEWMVNSWKESLGSETPLLLAALNEQAPVTLRVNTLITDRDECRKRLRMEGVETIPTRLSPAGLIAEKRFNAQSTAAFREGWYEVQDEGSQLVSLLAEPRPGMTVIDGCAGAGGKSLHLAALMKNTGRIVSLDLDQEKLSELDNRARRGAKSIIEPRIRTDELMLSLHLQGDLVIVDAPCSGTGTIRRNPGVKWRVTEQMIEKLSQDQQRILADYSGCVKPGGRLVYSTCSLLPAENETVITEFLIANPGFVLTSSGFPVPGRTPEAGPGFVCLYPHRTGTDGFFIAMMKRREPDFASSPDNS